MSWHDIACDENTEDRELRAELSGLLGLEPGVPVRPQAAVTADSSRMADELLREAQRRRRAVVPLVRKRTWPIFLAAGLPFALALAGVGTWGVVQKHRADSLAAAIRLKDAQVEQMAKASAEAAAQAAMQLEAARAVQPGVVRVRDGAGSAARPQELILPLTRTPARAPLETQTVSNPAR
nr:hypothetical protein [uncultured Holophaga sp.]